MKNIRLVLLAVTTLGMSPGIVIVLWMSLGLFASPAHSQSLTRMSDGITGSSTYYIKKSNIVQPNISLHIGHSWCTSGFLGENVRTHKKILLTAGHCFNNIDNQTVFIRNLAGKDVPIGHGTLVPHFQDPTLIPFVRVADDVAVITLNDDAPVSPLVDGNIAINTTSQPHRGNVAVGGGGAVVDHSRAGMVTDLHRGFFRVNTGIRHGDSGAPIVQNNEAIGLVSLVDGSSVDLGQWIAHHREYVIS